MKQTPLEQKISDMIEPVVADAGLSLVCVRMTGEGGTQTLQVMAEHAETRQIGIDECAKLSRDVAATLDVEDPIRGAYRLEVSSPGIDRPLMNAQDFIDFNDYEVKLEIFPPLEGQKRFRGYLRGLDGDDVSLETEQGPVTLALSSVQKARLVLTDELLAKAKALHDAKNPPIKQPLTEPQEDIENGTAAGR